MIAIDTNIMVAAIVIEQANHKDVMRWLEAKPDQLTTCHVNISETLRLLTHPKVFPSPLTMDKASSCVRDFVDAFGLSVLDWPEAWWLGLTRASVGFAIRGNDVFDAQIATCLRSHQIKKILTYDVAFKRFDFLKVLSP